MSRSLALFDIDGTLVPHPSTERRFAAWLADRGHVGWRQWLDFGLFALRYLPRYRAAVLQKNKAWLAGLQVDRIARQAGVFARDCLVPALDPAVTARLRAHQRAGDRIALLSGTPDFLARPLGLMLGVTDVVATRCIERDGRFTADPPARHPHGAAKRALARELAAAHGLPLDACVAYGDATADIALLDAVGRAVAVRPGRRLRQRALAAGWEILQPPGHGPRPGQPASPSGAS